jgi:release factor glutamine methyltransferase
MTRSAAGCRSKPLPEPGVRQVLREAVEKLADAGVDTPALDAELLLAEALGLRRERLVIEGPPVLAAAEVTRFEALLARRVDREPVAYILGSKPFRWITLAVDRRVLIPRPETEMLVEIGLALPSGARVVDVGTGSGAVALALAFERPDIEVLGTDLSADALAVAEENARRLGLDVSFMQADLLDGVPGSFDAVLGNLPYVIEGTTLEPEITRYEPTEALFAGPDGLELIRRLIAQVADIPLIALEIGPEQAVPVTDLLHDRGFRRTEVHRDLAGHQRIVVGRR